jgi:hypothetical protein
MGKTRGGNKTGQVGFRFGSDGSGQFDIMEEFGSGRIGLICMLYFFRSLIDFDWIEGHLISDWVGSGRIWIRTDQMVFSGRIGFCHL